jgi:hypothetical protein
MCRQFDSGPPPGAKSQANSEIWGGTGHTRGPQDHWSCNTLCPDGHLDLTMRRRSVAVVMVGMLLASCGIPPLAQATPAGDWTVVTDPFALVGRPVRLIFRFRDGEPRPIAESFAFSVTCTTCPEPKPVVTGTATKDRAGGELIYSTSVTFPSAGTWWTSPYVGPIEVR